MKYLILISPVDSRVVVDCTSIEQSSKLIKFNEIIRV